jgi:short subunit dehydrogenase-like uncharacterized protein
MTDKANREFDIMVYGATGFTGRLVAEYLSQQYAGKDDAPKWAMAGRSQEKLESVRDEIGAPADTPLVVADANDPASLEAMTKSTKVVISTVGPYVLYGNELVAACARNGTDYCDLAGEPNFILDQIEANNDHAKDSGARIVCSAGFDSIPFDLGVYMAQQHCKEKFGAPAPRIKGRMRGMQGAASGGTVASMQEVAKAAAKDPSLIAKLMSPFMLTEGFNGPEQPRGDKPQYDDKLQSWNAPFVMAPINTKNVHRTNTLLGHAYGENFVYDEMVMTGPGEKGEELAKQLAANPSFGSNDKTPAPGEGPSKEERENGFYDAVFFAEYEDGNSAILSVKGDRDPGYGSTSKMIAETAMCLLRDVPQSTGGVYTPASLLGEKLVQRLEANAGLTFTVES